MKRLIKKVSCLVIALLMCFATISFAGCEKIKKLEVKVLANNAEYTMEVQLYCHLAPKTCEKIIEYAEAGYYNEALIYKLASYSSQLMVGDLKLDSDSNVIQEIKPEIKGEFEKNGVVGSDLVAKKGSVGLWRTWQVADSSTTFKANSSYDTGRATMFIPTSDLSSYNGYFCNFAVIDLENSANLRALDALSAVFNAVTNYREYTVYYTGDYDANKADENYGLKFNIMLTDEYSEYKKTEEYGEANVFTAEGNQLACYNEYKVNISNNTKIVTVKVK
ncbi:MAG: peptidylprolyl isomerase [Clostridia bacterium]|nr:peptidylprolyl isomerase [Clostridia bacterium]